MRFLIVSVCFMALLCKMASPAVAQDALVHYVSAEKLRESKRILEAIDEYNEAIKLDPNNFKFHFQKAMCHLMIKQEEHALRAFTEVLRLEKGNIETHKRMAWLYQRKEQFEKAIYHFDQFYQHSDNTDDRVMSKITIIKILYKTGKFDQAEKHIQDALSIKPHDIVALYYAGKYYNSHGQYQKSKEYITKALDIIKSESIPTTAPYYYELCYAYYHLQEYDTLNNVLPKANHGPYKKEVVKLTSDYKYTIAKCYYEIYEFQKARDLLNEAILQDNTNTKVFDLQVKIAEATADKSTLIAHSKGLLETETDPIRRGRALNEIAQLYLSQQNFDASIQAASECLEINKGDYVVQYIKAIALHKKGMEQEAMDELIKLLKFNGLDISSKAKYNFTLGMISMGMGDQVTAKRAFTSAKLDNNYRFAAIDMMESMIQDQQ
ncbi:hypothetical protein V6R21_28365 [Limibacter armeniacum]|uniref:tetratricopeptide repeat protein n=1 Tax=Limibacter armeniacum TaxID=466084 RepID=UPI002FE51434